MVAHIADATKVEAKFDPDNFDWVQLKKDCNILEGETRRDRFLRKINENPVVPVGMCQGGAPVCAQQQALRKSIST